MRSRTVLAFVLVLAMAFGLSITLAGGSSSTAHAASLTTTLCVTPTPTSGCYTSIQAAIEAAPAGAAITIAAGTYQQDVVIDRNVSLVGAGASSTVISPPPNQLRVVLGVGQNVTAATMSGLTVNGKGQVSRVVENDGTLSVSGCTFTGGKGNSTNSDALVTGYNLLNYGTMNVSNATLDGANQDNVIGLNNFAGTVTISNSSVVNNYRGIEIDAGKATISSDTFNGNGAGNGRGNGDDIRIAGGTATISGSTVSDGSSFAGIEIDAGAVVTVSGSTVSQSNTGILMYGGTATINDSTIAHTAMWGIEVLGGTLQVSDSAIRDNPGNYFFGGVGIDIANSSGTVTLSNSLVSHNGHDGIDNAGTLHMINAAVGRNGGLGVSNTGTFTLDADSFVAENAGGNCTGTGPASGSC